MWMVVGVANNKTMADNMQKALEREGILVELRAASVRASRASNTFEILVLESEAESSREILLENGF